MRIDFEFTWVIAVLLCTLRVAALFMVTPVLQILGLPARVRVLLVLALSLALVTGMQLTPVTVPSDFPALLAACVKEAVLGGLMGFGILTAFSAFAFAGNALDLQIGFNIANIFDPITRSQAPLLAAFFGMVAMMLFFTMDMHHMVMRGLAYSIERLPLAGPIELASPSHLAKQFGTIFSLGLVLAAPPLFFIFLIEIALAVLSRNMPQLNIFMFGTPIKIAVGLLILASTTTHFGTVASKIFDSIFAFWEGML
jgi:flagellar biosynthetic protein FliR